MDINQQIKSALEKAEGVELWNFHRQPKEKLEAAQMIQDNAHSWLSHQATEIERLKAGIRLMRDEVFDAYVPAYLSAKISRKSQELLNDFGEVSKP